MVISIDKADYVREYQIKFLFSDGVERLIDFSRFLKNAKNPMTKNILILNCSKNIQLYMEI